ncbi:hypothetical protein, partial [Arachidicoccus sp.]|uniref:hypothetical protein n=1 Tax=Arachidicoccus sp. TaxID=1872624 RepID=UPI003D236F92
MSFEIPKKLEISETEVYKKFSADIDYCVAFFEGFGQIVFRRLISFITAKNVLVLNTELIDSAVQTLKSIKLCCSIGSFADANALIRKLRDDLILYVYILNVIDQRKPFKEDPIDIKTDNAENFADSISKLHFNDTLSEDEKAISAWLSNNVNELPNPIKRKLEFKNYMNVLKENEHIYKILEDYKLSDYWEKLRRSLND